MEIIIQKQKMNKFQVISYNLIYIIIIKRKFNYLTF